MINYLINIPFDNCLMVIFCVTVVQAETKEGTTGTAKQWWQDGYVPPPKAEEPAAPAEVAAPKAEKPLPEKVSMPLDVKFDTAKSDIKMVKTK
ncbi:MAG: hypothetical protein STSR0002_20290 [Smithella sp.]|jgi:hypothetical protein